ncbi:hypothetical protein DDB_G0274927 [Dictyostelium discoideum AX4]|uniref:Uncharacterized protein n=1 Tax=Dictyostelium discoideum TaxID=44689 RepID=Q555A4_DICDI|nr:hypothetical protein DDB_G0274927 [Dictyostelium discoideum AX4]EAL70356.1 hypothetical protein DDB_G0274927 [Dictyostelium discoideum AX4]|eukprot:XP_644169.1 hypothetical protein DDB_G0274927 [Dictyostelium discoideum AX4]
METNNYFKIKYLIESLLVSELKDKLFELILTNTPKTLDIRSPKKYETLYRQNDLQGYRALTIAEKLLLQIGNHENFSFKLITNIISILQVKKEVKNVVDSIKEFKQYLNLNFDNIKDFKISIEKFKEIIEMTVKFLKKIRLSGVVCVDEQIIQPMNSNSVDDYWLLPHNKNQVNTFKDNGNKLFSRGEFDKAIESYLGAFTLGGLSDSIKGILYLNISTCFLAKVNDPKRIINLVEQYPLPIHESLRYSILSLSKRPNWFKPYYRIAQIFSKFSKFERSIQFSDCSLSLLSNNNENQNDKSSIEETNKFKFETNEKLKLSNQCKLSDKERDFEKECKLRIEKLGNLHLNQFKEVLTDKFKILIKKQTGKSYEKYFNSSITFGLSEKHLIERFISDVVRLRTFPNLDLQAEAFSRCIGNQTKYAQPYFEFANSLIPSNPKDFDIRNNQLIIGLMLHASTLPPNFDLINNGNSDNDDELFNIHKINGGVIRAQEFLGYVYRSGLFGEDIDLEKSIYYFNKSIENADGIQVKYLHISGYQCLSPFILSDMYYNGDVPNGVSDLEKAKQLYQLFNDTKYDLMQLFDKYDEKNETDLLYHKYLYMKTNEL